MYAGRIWITCTTLLIAFIAYSPQIAGFFYSSAFNFAILYLFYNYFQTVCTDPGSTPDNWQPSQPTSRFCKKCETPKPPRAHHCRYCKKCVLRYDHHCPWVNNCIGLRNYTYFLRFLFAVDVCCAAHLYLLTSGVLNEDNLHMLTVGRLERGVATGHIVLLVANYVLCIPVAFAIGLFSLYHFWNLASNTTTIEGNEIDKVRKMMKRGKIKHTPFPFNMSISTNITSILGTSALDWFFLGKPCSDGLSYPSREGTDQANWPPRDPYDSLRETWAREAEHGLVPAALDPRRAAIQADDTACEGRVADDDDVPLAYLAQRSVRLRRGSEGFEVRPVLHHNDDSSSHSSESASDNPDWDELYERREILYDSGSDDE